MRSAFQTTYLVFALCWSATATSKEDAGTQKALINERVDFNRDVRPILSENCFLCHGPDQQKAGLRLDLPESALEKKAVVPGDTRKSALLHRIQHANPTKRMPPRDSKRELNSSQIATLKRWIAEGAKYDRHWAFQPVVRPETPQDPRASSPLDAFVYRRLDVEGLAPSEGVDRETLLRRVTLDLTGVPPSIPEIDHFLADESPDAYERVVDRLLSSPKFGERLARPWLDVARYADTFGYDNDYDNGLWPWRDWVVRTLNSGVGYDDFIRWQIAGDMLPSASQEQVLATAFHRLHRQNAEGGALAEEFLVEYRADRVQTFATAFLGITLECARCHDHKFDPIPQREYYSLYALFSNIDEAGLHAEKTGATPTPNIFLYGSNQKREHERLQAAIREREASYREERKSARARFQTWLATEPILASPKPVSHLHFDDRAKAQASGPSASFPGSARIISGARGNAIRWSG
ncbi:MAG: DUF1549 domain-containing protein, partial [Planctomycetota bacterium]